MILIINLIIIICIITVVIIFVIVIIIPSFQCFWLLLAQFFIPFYNFVYIKYFWILNIWHSQALFKVGNKATETTLVPLLWILNNVWHKNILALIIISFILHFLIKIYYIAELSVFLFVTWFQNDRASGKRNIYASKYLNCEFFCPYVSSHKYKVCIRLNICKYVPTYLPTYLPNHLPT